MKYLHYTLVSLLFVALFSCSKDGDSAKPSKTIAGKWRMTSFTYTGTSTATVDGQSFTTPFSGVGKDIDVSMTFAEDPNTFTIKGGYTIAITMDAGGQQVTQDVPINGFAGSGTWKKDGNQVIVTNEATGKDATWMILQLDDKTLKVHVTGPLSPVNSYNIPLTVVVNAIYVFERE